MNHRINPELVNDAIVMKQAHESMCDVLELIEDDTLRAQIIGACADYCAAFIVGAVHAIQFDAEQELESAIAEATKPSVN